MPCLHRIDAGEWLDDPDASLAETRESGHNQETANRWLGGTRAVMAHALPFIRRCGSCPIHTLDIACGSADIPRRLVEAARRLRKPIHVTALDLNEKLLSGAREVVRGYPEIRLVRGDALAPPFAPGSFDLVTIATFLHHLPPESVVSVLATAQALSRGSVVVSDLVRSPLAYLGIRLFARLAGFGPMSTHDGPVSVCRAYTPAEVEGMAGHAGIARWRLHRHWPYRMTLVFAGRGVAGS